MEGPTPYDIPLLRKEQEDPSAFDVDAGAVLFDKEVLALLQVRLLTKPAPSP